MHGLKKNPVRHDLFFLTVKRASSVSHAKSLVPNDVHEQRDFLYNHVQNCSNQKDLSAARQSHCLMVANGLDSVSKFGDHLIRSFALCGDLIDASRVFSGTFKPTSYTWTAIILAHSTLGEADNVFKLYEKMGQVGIEASKYVYSSVLKVCCTIGAIDRGKSIHADIVISGLEIDAVLASMLMNVYIELGSIDEARKVFNSSSSRDVVLWGTMIAGYTQHGKGFQAIELFKEMQNKGIRPDEVTYSCILKACGSIAAIELGMLIHEEIVRCGVESDVVVGNTLTDMYINCGNFIEAQYSFDCLLTRSVVSWGTMIAGYVQYGHDVQALALFKRMQAEEVYTGKVTILFSLRACCNIKSLDDGQILHGIILYHGYDADVAVGSALVDMYAKSGGLEEAHIVFERLPERNVYSWNAMISGYVRAGLSPRAFYLFDKMQEEGVNPDKATLSCTLTACANLESLREGRVLHDHVLRCGFLSDVIVMNSLIDMYAKCGDLVSALNVFRTLVTKDGITWGIVIAGYAQHGHGFLALDFFNKMQREGIKGDRTTLVSVLKACGLLGEVSNGRIVHDHIVRSEFEQDIIVGNTLVDMYAKCGSLMEAGKSFQTLSKRSVISWNAMIVGFVHHAHYTCAIEFFDKMQQEGLVPDRVTFSCILKACSSLGVIGDGKRIHEKVIEDGFQSSMVVGSTLVDMYAKCGSLEEARDLFDQMPNRGLVSWGAMIMGYSLQGNGFEALSLYWKMTSEGLQPDKVTLLCVLKGCCSMGALAQGKLIHAQVIKSSYDADVAIGSLLVNMYAKFGCLEDAQRLLNDMQDQNIASCNAIVGGYAQQGDWRKARKCLADLQTQGMRPVGTTYTNILAACSQTGRVDEAYHSLKSLTEEEDVDSKVEHFNCFIDLLGRAGRLGEAVKMLCSTPILPGIIGWMSLLAACKTYGQTDLGRACLDQIVQLDPNTAAGYTIMSNIYADAQNWEDVDAMQELRRCMGAWKVPGKAWIEVNNEVFEFLVDDLESIKLQPVLKRMQFLLKSKGHVPHLDLVIGNMRNGMDRHYDKLIAACG